MTLFAIAGLPILLTGAALVGLPILLHLIMRQEPKRLPFPAFRFLKQKRQINQRKIRLRHWLLLALRMALIALICLSLFQPTLVSEGFSLRGDRPVAAVLVLDTSPSMGYVLSERTGLTEGRQRGLKLLEEPAQGPWTCLDEARGRIMEILEDIPPGSRVAIIDTADRAEPQWLASVAEARQRVRDIKKPRANSQPVTRALESAYTMLSRVDTDLEPGQEPLPRLLAVFSDRTTPSWDGTRIGELQSIRERVPLPSVQQIFMDVGIDKPVNAAITAFEMKPQVLALNQNPPAVISVTLEATGGTAENIVQFSIDNERAEQVPVSLAPGRPVTRSFTVKGVKPGLHTAQVRLLTADALPFDNEKFISFRVRQPRNVLAVVDTPPEALLTGVLGAIGRAEARARIWKEAVEAKGWYECEVRMVEEVDVEKFDWSKYEQVTLLGLSRPSARLWESLYTYVRNGGQLIVAPGGPETNPRNYGESAKDVLPVRFTEWEAVPEKEEKGATWTWNALSPQRPMLALFRRYRDEYPAAFDDDNAPSTRGYWKVADGNRDRVVVAYNDAPAPEQRSPAVLERAVGLRGKVLQLTVPMGAGSEAVHNYFRGSWFYLVLVNEMVQYLTGDSEDLVMNFTAGQNVLVKWPASDGKPQTYFLSGPDVSTTDSTIQRTSEQPFLRFGPEKTASAGHVTVHSEDGQWTDGFSINAPPEESNLERLPGEAVPELFGADSVFTADKKLTIGDILEGRFSQPIELFPFLLILLLLVLAVENLLANKFYRRKRASG